MGPGLRVPRNRDDTAKGSPTKKPRRFAPGLDRGPEVRSGARSFRLWRRAPLQRPPHLFEVEALDGVAGLDVLEALERHAAFLAGLHLVDLVLEALERLQDAQLQDDHIVAHDPHAGALAHHALGDPAAGDAADLG